MGRNKFKITVVLLLALANQTMAQATDVEMAETLRSNGKIYVVVTILCVVLAALLIYLFSIDRKVKKLEDRFKNK